MIFEVLFSYLLLILSLTDTSSCREHFSGKWKYDKYTLDQIYVERTDKKQIEYLNGGEYWFEYTIQWTSECEYQLTYVGTNSSDPPIVNEGEKFNVEIIFINDSIMQFKTTFRESIDEGSMRKIITD